MENELIVIKCSFDRITHIQKSDLSQSNTIGLLVRAKIRAAFGLDVRTISVVSEGKIIGQNTSPTDIFNKGIRSIFVNKARPWGQ
eukprot:1824858-Heterocapsa_arctica.AAC.1